jgi:hypothetical protein
MPRTNKDPAPVSGAGADAAGEVAIEFINIPDINKLAEEFIARKKWELQEGARRHQ